MSRVNPVHLALSGGGTRAMAFHAGVLKYLAQCGALGRVKNISTVSGGSLLVGLVFHISDYRWPTDSQYLESVLPHLEDLLSDTYSEAKISYARFIPDFLQIRENAHWLTSSLIEGRWGIRKKWGDLPRNPKWTVNVTNAETGKRMTFCGKILDCYQLGRTNAEEFHLANVMAASAAVPGVVGPWILKIDHADWMKPRKDIARNINLLDSLDRIHLYDGGLYDNLGLEEFVNVGTGFKKPYQSGAVIVSDAGKPLDQTFDRSVMNPLRAFDILAIPMDQTRALRVRDFMSHIQKRPGSGAHLRLGESFASIKNRNRKKNLSLLSKSAWQDDDTVRAIAAIDTRLKGYRPKELRKIITHGYESARMSLIISGIPGFD